MITRIRRWFASGFAEPRVRERTSRRWFKGIVLGSSGLLILGLTVCYGGRFDACAAITVFPVWLWLVPGLLLAALGLRRRGNRPVAVVGSGWLVFLLAIAEEPWSLARLAMPSRSMTRGESVRVVSLNCDIGNPGAVEEAAGDRPEVILLQESPDRETLRRLARKLVGEGAGIVHGVDASLIVRGRVIPAELSSKQRATFVQARVRLDSGAEIEVISTRLIPAVFRFDLWSPDCWREQAENRRRHGSRSEKSPGAWI